LWCGCGDEELAHCAGAGGEAAWIRRTAGGGFGGRGREDNDREAGGSTEAGGVHG
jgi:hypothetical protein